MNNKSIQNIIKKIEDIIGPCIYDEDDEEHETFELWIDECCGVGFEVDTESLVISPFATFSYSDFSKTDLRNGNYDAEELENEVTTRLLQSSFTCFLKSHSPNYTVSVWDDGCFMCPGFVARVGFLHEPFTDALIKDFWNLYLEYSSTIARFSDSGLRRYVFKSICHNHGVKVKEDSNLFFGNASLKISDSKNIHDNNVEYYHLGKEKLLFSVLDDHYVTDVCPIEIFIEAHDMCELSDDISFTFNNPPLFDSPVLRVVGPYMELTIPAYYDDNQLYSKIEESTAIMSYSSILPFASEQFREVLFAVYPDIMDLHLGLEPVIITEGSTDWKHLKKYWEQYIQEKLKIQFWEYEPANSRVKANRKQEMGSSILLEMCKSFSKMALGKVFIFIADCDEIRIVKEMGGREKKYKDWGNGVYSFVLPVPAHRRTTPEICIEHYYSDDEIKNFYICADGKERRLFLGNDFDKYGRNINNGLLCVKRSLCGPDSIKVIDGSSDTRVISMNEKSDTNYALSKQEFASRSVIRKNSETYNAFQEVFNIIQTIIKDHRQKRQE